VSAPQPYDGFLETALGRAENDEAKHASEAGLSPSITYTEEFESGRTFAISPQVEAILGYSQEEWMGDADLWIERIHPEDRDRVVAACEHSNEIRATYVAEYRIVARDGRIVWLHDEAVLVFDSEGQPLCWQGVMSVIAPPD
jgi:PAS domain S-box-containing protein